MADSGTRVTGPAPGEEPWEFEWPDDARELRAAEREAARKRAEVRPAPRFLTAYLVGVWTVLTFVLLVTFYEPALFLSLVAPVALIGLVAALPLGFVLEAVTRRSHVGVSGLVFVLTGAVVGYFWSYMIVTWIYNHDGVVFDAANSSDRTAVAVLFMTATATAFFAARMYTDSLRRNPKSVWVAAISLFVLFVPSAVSAVRDLAAYL
ncbi:MAG: hypothetical protein JW722_01780 [Demequinaceae bacterium]|nr:hypothetical protein [Demequinaceae bacterium]